MTIRKAIAVDIAAALGTPQGDQPGGVGGLGDPHAPGHGHELGQQVGDAVHQDQFGHVGVVLERPQAEPTGMMAWSSWAPASATTIPTLEGERETRRAVVAEEA